MDKTKYQNWQVIINNEVAQIDPESPEKKQALKSLVQLLHHPEHLFQSIQNGKPRVTVDVMSPLRRLIFELDLDIIVLCSEALLIFAGHSVGRAFLSQAIVTGEFNNLLLHHDPRISENMLLALSLLSSTLQGTNAILKAGLLNLLIDILPKATFNKQVLILETLFQLIKFGNVPYIPDHAMQLELMEKLVFLIKSSTDSQLEVKVNSLRVLMGLANHSVSKKRAVEIGLVSTLLGLVRSQSTEVVVAATGALMMVSVDVEAKKNIVKEGGVDTLKLLLESQDEKVLINAVQTIANVAEDYRARFMFQGSLQKLSQLSGSDLLRNAVQRATLVITWRP